MSASNSSSKLHTVIGGVLVAVGIAVFSVRFLHEGAYAMPGGGNLFGGLLSGGLYQHYGPVERGGVDNTGVMWVIFAGLAMVSVVLLSVYDKWVKARPQA